MRGDHARSIYLEMHVAVSGDDGDVDRHKETQATVRERNGLEQVGPLIPRTRHDCPVCEEQLVAKADVTEQTDAVGRLGESARASVRGSARQDARESGSEVAEK